MFVDTIICSPPYYTQMKSTEIIWAQLKQYVAQTNTAQNQQSEKVPWK
jgi:tRNA1(Val) A37 N6-methylase TrmN6